MMDINANWPQWSLDFFIKELLVGAVKNENISNKELVEEFTNQLLENQKKRKVHSSFICNIQGTDLADMQLISKFNEKISFFTMCYRYFQ